MWPTKQHAAHDPPYCSNELLKLEAIACPNLLRRQQLILIISSLCVTLVIGNNILYNTHRYSIRLWLL